MAEFKHHPIEVHLSSIPSPSDRAAVIILLGWFARNGTDVCASKTRIDKTKDTISTIKLWSRWRERATAKEPPKDDASFSICSVDRSFAVPTTDEGTTGFATQDECGGITSWAGARACNHSRLKKLARQEDEIARVSFTAGKEGHR